MTSLALLSRALLLLSLALLTASCAMLCGRRETAGRQAAAGAPATPSASGVLEGRARVVGFTLDTAKSGRGELALTVRGQLPDPCTHIARTTQTLAGRTLRLTIITGRPAAVLCAQVITPFLKTFPVDIRGLAPGEYILDVDGVQERFEVPDP